MASCVSTKLKTINILKMQNGQEMSFFLKKKKSCIKTVGLNIFCGTGRSVEFTVPRIFAQTRKWKYKYSLIRHSHTSHRLIARDWLRNSGDTPWIPIYFKLLEWYYLQAGNAITQARPSIVGSSSASMTEIHLFHLVLMSIYCFITAAAQKVAPDHHRGTS